jgi:hypothetical protein
MSTRSGVPLVVLVHGGFVPPPAQRTMSTRANASTTEVAGSHAINQSQPAAVAAIVRQAASAMAARR